MLTGAAIIVKNIPPPHHQSRTPLVSHDKRWLYVSVGSGSNVDADDSRSRVIRYNITGAIPQGGFQWNDYNDSRVQAFAPGLRNEVGLSLDFGGVLWGVMNADDELNRTDLGGYPIHNDNPAERLDRLSEDKYEHGGWYGYPQVIDISPSGGAHPPQRCSLRCTHRVPLSPMASLVLGCGSAGQSLAWRVRLMHHTRIPRNARCPLLTRSISL